MGLCPLKKFQECAKKTEWSLAILCTLKTKKIYIKIRIHIKLIFINVLDKKHF